MATAIANVLIQSRINLLYTNVFNAAIKIETHISKARTAALISFNNPTDASKKEAWDELDQAENLSVSLTNENKSFLMSLLPFEDLTFKLSVQRLQELLGEYRGQFGKIFVKNTAPSDSLVKEWNHTYVHISDQNEVIEVELNKLITKQSQIFRFAQLGLVISSILLTLVAIFIFFRYENQSAAYLRKIEEASNNLAIGSRKTTRAEEALHESQRK
ncbi:MAG: hypothetical protein Q8S39_03195, partial [Ignavibacteria bacterium]|nr:hypothetical protein [Ignavibacteria bacterium]